MSPITALTVIFVALLFAIIGYAIGDRKEAGAGGCLLGLLLGPLGAILAIALDNRYKCPVCGERVNRGALICAHCRCGLSWRRWGSFVVGVSAVAPMTSPPPIPRPR